MQRVGLLVKEKIIDEIRTRLESYNSVIFVSFNKVGAYPLNILRNNIREKGGNFFVAKNSLVERVFSIFKKDIKDFFKEQTAIVFASEDNIVDVSKILFDFIKENENFKIKGGILGDKKVDYLELEGLSKLPPKDILLGNLLSTFMGPLVGFGSVIQQSLLDFILIIEDLKKRKEDKS